MESRASAFEKVNSGRIKLRAFAVSLLVLYAGLVAWIDTRTSPNPDETAHLTAGGLIWQSGRFDLYPVNPPLVRMVAAMPMVYGYPEGNWKALHKEQHDLTWDARPEWSMGSALVRDNPDRAIWYFTLARWACIPFGLIGGYFCWRWADELYGTWAAALALMLWCLSPNVIAWSATICPDVAAASLGIAACYFFWRWLKEPSWFFALLAGIVLGLAELTKMTWLILFAVWPLIWLVWLWGRRHEGEEGTGSICRDAPGSASHKLILSPFLSQALQLAGILGSGLFVVSLGYGFSGAFTKLGDYTFVSHTLAGKDSVVEGGHGGNRFAESWLRCVPVPLPRDYLQGIDLQKMDFERGLPSYLFGQWSQHGWWYYYIVCAILKVPLGIWMVGLLAVGARLRRLRTNARRQPEAGHERRQDNWLDEVALLLPAIVLIVFVSSQTGFSRHFRYVLPAFPFLFVWIGSVAQAVLRKRRTTGVCVACSLTWMVVSSLSVYPHSLSYFNELAGGPMGGPRYLLDANIDWGQDVLYLKEWYESHPEATPLNVAFRNSYSEAFLEVGDRVRNLDVSEATSPKQSTENHKSPVLGPKPGWYAVSVHRIHDFHDHYQYFRQFTPVTTAGYSIYIYRITIEEANRVRKAVGLPELPSGKVAGL